MQCAKALKRDKIEVHLWSKPSCRLPPTVPDSVKLSCNRPVRPRSMGSTSQPNRSTSSFFPTLAAPHPSSSNVDELPQKGAPPSGDSKENAIVISDDESDDGSAVELFHNARKQKAGLTVQAHLLEADNTPDTPEHSTPPSRSESSMSPSAQVLTTCPSPAVRKLQPELTRLRFIDSPGDSGKTQRRGPA